MSTARRCFGSSDLPKQSHAGMVMEPSGSGRWAGKELEWSELDWALIWERMGVALQSTGTWEEAKSSVERYIGARKIEPAGLWPHSVEDHYLKPLLQIYVREIARFAYVDSRAKSVIGAMLRHLESPDVLVVGLIILEGLAAASPFRLGKNLQIRPIQESELRMLACRGGMLDVPYWLGPRVLVPRTDWWVCEARLRNPRGTALGWNGVHEVCDTLALALRAFKPGGVSLGVGTTQLADPFGRTGQIWGGRLERTAVGESSYELSEQEIAQFGRFWRKFRRLMEEETHYLHVPIRRLRIAGTRAEREDALVDYVVGLEALLGTVDERTELGFRFRIRGSVVLADKKSERKGKLRELRELYNLRSRIVHGQAASESALEKALPLAENALRRVWNWYFRCWCSERDNRAAIERIDELLVG